jgi:hypothetical protein
MVAKQGQVMRALCLLITIALTGCAAAPRIETRIVNVAVPVTCQEPVPARPALPTESLRRGVMLDRVTAAALAEIELREGYEQRLRTALDNCRR